MGTVAAVFQDGNVEPAHAVDWPNGTRLEVTPINQSASRAERSFLPLFEHEFHESSSEHAQAGELSFDEFEAALDELASASDSIPILPPQAYARESIYGFGK